MVCDDCNMAFEDVYRSTLCPHDTFAANDGHNNFAHHPEAYLKPLKEALAEERDRQLNAIVAGWVDNNVEVKHDGDQAMFRLRQGTRD